MDEFEEENRLIRKEQLPKCSVQLCLNAISPEQRESLERALAMSKSEMAHVAISSVLKRWGYAVQPQTIARHRAKRCSCE